MISTFARPLTATFATIALIVGVVTLKSGRVLKIAHAQYMQPLYPPLINSSPASKRLRSQHAPVLNIEPNNVVALRVGDVLIRNLVFEIVKTGRKGT